jgi:hypothetical protein
MTARTNETRDRYNNSSTVDDPVAGRGSIITYTMKIIISPTKVLKNLSSRASGPRSSSSTYSTLYIKSIPRRTVLCDK